MDQRLWPVPMFAAAIIEWKHWNWHYLCELEWQFRRSQPGKSNDHQFSLDCTQFERCCDSLLNNFWVGAMFRHWLPSEFKMVRQPSTSLVGGQTIRDYNEWTLAKYLDRFQIATRDLDQ